MAQDSVLLEKSLLFAARIVKLHRYLTKEEHEVVISRQIIRSATSIGANANEAVYGSSPADFLAKLHISLKETAETEYWLRLLVLSEYLTDAEGQSLLRDCLEIKRILVASINTTKANRQRQELIIMIGAVIYYGKNTLVAELPMGALDLQMKLSSIGVGEPADRIPLKDHRYPADDRLHHRSYPGPEGQEAR